MSAQKKPATASELYSLTKHAQALAYELTSKYQRRQIHLKAIGASRKAIKANAKRQELAKELLTLLGKYELIALKKMRKEYTARKYLQFTVN